MHIIFLFLVQCKSKLSNKIIKSTSTESSCVPETDKLLELIMKNDSRAGINNLLYTYIKFFKHL
jgi:hypothetical protein